MANRSHLSIGEVLSLLLDEFPDVTISKIRFLESQGLVDPERTPSGYRKFYDADIERLRWVLRQQRDSFLPLRVIKGRLERASDAGETEDGGTLAAGEAADEGPGGASLGFGLPAKQVGGEGGALSSSANGRAGTRPDAQVGGVAPVAGDSGTGQLFDAGPAYGSSGHSAHRGRPRWTSPGRAAWSTGPTSAPQAPAPLSTKERGARGTAVDQREEHEHRQAPARQPPGAEPGSARRSRAGSRRATAPPSSARTGGARGAELSPVASRRSAPRASARDFGEEGDLTLDELAHAAAVGPETVRDLELYGLIAPRVIGGTSYYAPEALVVAQLAGAFARHGVEARHLRAYKSAAEREAGMVQQVVMPLIKQRNPEARRAAAEAAEELAELGGRLRAALLRAALADIS